MKVIEVKTVSLGDKDQYSPMSYPEAGCFLVAENNYNIYFVNKGQVWTAPLEYMIIKDIEDKKDTNLTNDFILELVAVSQNPEIVIGLKK